MTPPYLTHNAFNFQITYIPPTTNTTLHICHNVFNSQKTNLPQAQKKPLLIIYLPPNTKISSTQIQIPKTSEIKANNINICIPIGNNLTATKTN